VDKVFIRPVNKEEIEQICKIAVAAWQEIHAGYREYIGNKDLVERITHDWQTRKAEQVRTKAEETPDEVVVAESDGRIIGFATFSLNRKTGIGEIGNNAVSPDCQGLGVGKMLYNKVLEIFRREGMKYAIVSTGYEDSGHAKARASYEKVGFKKMSTSITYSLEL